VSMLPMASFLSTSVSTDGMLITLWTWALWLGARVINRRAQPGDVAALCAVTAAAVLTKSTSYALLVGVLPALVFGWLRRGPGERRRALLRLSPLLLILVLPIAGWLALSLALNRPAVNTIGSGGTEAFSVSLFLDYVWEFYLPKLSFMKAVAGENIPERPFYIYWIHQGTAAFGWLVVMLPAWVYTAATVIWATLSVATLGLLTRLRGSRSLMLLAFYALTLIGLLGLLHITEFRSIISGGGQFMQGRYIYPLIGLFGLAVALIITRVPRAWRAPVCGLVLIGLFTMQALSLATVLHAWYV
jgi:hypothetical protein